MLFSLCSAHQGNTGRIEQIQIFERLYKQREAISIGNFIEENQKGTNWSETECLLKQVLNEKLGFSHEVYALVIYVVTIIKIFVCIVFHIRLSYHRDIRSNSCILLNCSQKTCCKRQIKGNMYDFSNLLGVDQVRVLVT